MRCLAGLMVCLGLIGGTCGPADARRDRNESKVARVPIPRQLPYRVQKPAEQVRQSQERCHGCAAGWPETIRRAESPPFDFERSPNMRRSEIPQVPRLDPKRDCRLVPARVRCGR
jgi:hypothetical protein